MYCDALLQLPGVYAGGEPRAVLRYRFTWENLRLFVVQAFVPASSLWRIIKLSPDFPRARRPRFSFSGAVFPKLFLRGHNLEKPLPAGGIDLCLLGFFTFSASKPRSPALVVPVSAK
ncbi:hypothetical protein E2C01_039080 [Portunus trituberculatus]|uniref:Uncharacterized protein n=1 Tax=Portunus trituberculatus TaxID=210409 RepID=A0A5B7FFW9_PORTR|nr:hypothetical protein [Portunus trituberculatus]